MGKRRTSSTGPKVSRSVTRSAITGKFVKPGYAKQHPRTTVRERVSVGKPRKKKK